MENATEQLAKFKEAVTSLERAVVEEQFDDAVNRIAVNRITRLWFDETFMTARNIAGNTALQKMPRFIECYGIPLTPYHFNVLQMDKDLAALRYAVRPNVRNSEQVHEYTTSLRLGTTVLENHWEMLQARENS